MNYATPQQLVAFEDEIKGLWEAGELPCLLHLSGGNEEDLCRIFEKVREGDWIFSTHRNHFHALCAGVSASRLKQLILDGRSMFVFDRQRKFLSSAILAGTASIAAGVAYDLKSSGSKNRVWCFIGEGAVAEGHFWEALNFVQGHQLPCFFVIEDNGRQVDTPKGEQRGPFSVMDLALAMYPCVMRYEYTPVYPHAGSGCKHKIEFKPEAIERMRKENAA